MVWKIPGHGLRMQIPRTGGEAKILVEPPGKVHAAFSLNPEATCMLREGASLPATGRRSGFARAPKRFKPSPAPG